MKKEIAARLSEGKVVDIHTKVHDGRNYVAHVAGGNVIITNNNTGETHRVSTPPNPSMFGNTPAANDQHPDKGWGHSMAMIPFLKKAEQIKTNVPPEKQIEITDRHAKHLLDAAVKKEKISEGVVEPLNNLPTHTTTSGKYTLVYHPDHHVMVHNNEQKTIHRLPGTIARDLQDSVDKLGRPLEDSDVRAIQKMTAKTAVRIYPPPKE